MISNKVACSGGVGILAALVAATLGACGAGAGPSSGAITVVAAENVWGDITAQIGGSHVRVTSLITDPNADPHIYESSPQDAAAVQEAQLVIENGAGYDDFMDNLLGAAGGSSRQVLNVEHIVGVTGSNPNPHLWYGPQFVTTMAQTIERTLASLDHGDSTAFAANLAAFDTSYARYAQVIGEISSRHPQARVAYTERVAGYLVQAAGMVLVSPPGFAQSIEDGNDPAPGDVAAMDTALSTRQASVLLYNAQVTSPATVSVLALAQSSHIPVVGVDETLPAGTTFVAWQVAQASAILAALGG